MKKIRAAKGLFYFRLTMHLVFVLLLSACAPGLFVHRAAVTVLPIGNQPGVTPQATTAGKVEPGVIVRDQEFDGKTVYIPRVISNGPGWLTIHNQQNKVLGPIIGKVQVNDGVNFNVVIPIDPKQITTVLYAVLQEDAGAVGVYEYPGPDVPVFVNSVMVSPQFKITFQQPLFPALASHNQDITSGKVQADQVVSIGPGWVVIRDTRPDGQPGKIIGSTSVNDGKSLGVTVTIDPKQATPSLVVMLYVDAGEIGMFESPGPDIPAVVNGKAVAQQIQVTEETGNVSGNTGLAVTVPTLVPAATMTASSVPSATASPVPSQSTTSTARPALTSTAAPTTPPTIPPQSSSTPAALGPAWKGQQIGGSLQVQVTWSGADLNNFNFVIKPFEDQTGINVQVTTNPGNQAPGTGQGGPDVVQISNPGLIPSLAQQNILKPLDSVLDMGALQKQVDPGFLSPGKVNGQTYGLVVRATVKSLVWYDPLAYQTLGLPVPKTWQDLQNLEQQLATKNLRTWCIGVSGGPGSGWPGTDWVEDILLHQAGPAVYDQWVTHQIPWTDDAVRQAWQTWGSVINNANYVFGGPSVAAQSNFSHAFNRIFTPIPGCFLYKSGDFITEYFLQQFPNLKAGVDYNFFPFPSPNPQHQDTLEVSGDLFGMMNDTLQARALIQYLASPDAQTIWASRSGSMVPNKLVNPAMYRDDLSRSLYQLLTSSKGIRFDGSDQMPPDVENAFSLGVLIYAGHPEQLDAILSNIETQAMKDYQK